MLKKLSLLLCVLMGITSCYKYNRPEKPEPLLTKEKMAHILIDLKIINAVTGLDKRVLDSANVTADGYIYKKYNIDSIQFAQNNAYYAYYVDEYEEIYALAKDSLDKLKAKYDSIVNIEKEAKKIKDSLQRIEKDSLKNIQKETIKELEGLEIEAELIEPISDTDLTPQ